MDRKIFGSQSGHMDDAALSPHDQNSSQIFSYFPMLPICLLVPDLMSFIVYYVLKFEPSFCSKASNWTVTHDTLINSSGRLKQQQAWGKGKGQTDRRK